MSEFRAVKICAAASALLVGMSLGASSAMAAACTTAPVGTYTASGFSCSVGPVTFSNIVLSTTTSGSGSIALTDFTPFTTTFNGVTEYGLELKFAADTGFSGGAADVGWTYDVSGVRSLFDAYASLAGGTIGPNAAATLSEVLSNGTTLSLTGPGVTSATFSPIDMLHAIKDQHDFAASGSASFSSIVSNGFSVVPEPSTWAMMAIGFAALGYAGFRNSRKQRFQAI